MAESTGLRKRPGSIFVLAGCNGAGKSSVGGAALRQSGAVYFNPDEAAVRIASANVARRPPLTPEQINSAAWNEGRRLVRRAIDENRDFAFETTLGGGTMTAMLLEAAQRNMSIHVWFAGLASVELHIERVRRRVEKGGHAIPEAAIRERFEKSRINLIRLLPHLAELYLYDNSAEGDPDSGTAPQPRLLLHARKRLIVRPMQLASLLADTPPWAKPIASASIKLHMAQKP